VAWRSASEMSAWKDLYLMSVQSETATEQHGAHLRWGFERPWTAQLPVMRILLVKALNGLDGMPRSEALLAVGACVAGDLLVVGGPFTVAPPGGRPSRHDARRSHVRAGCGPVLHSVPPPRSSLAPVVWLLTRRGTTNLGRVKHDTHTCAGRLGTCFSTVQP
jgi:hypothetical protein